MNHKINALLYFIHDNWKFTIAGVVIIICGIFFTYDSCRSGYVDKESQKHDQRTEERSERERAEFYKVASEKRNDALAGNDLRTQIFREQQADDKAEILRLRSEIQRLRNPGILSRIFNPDVIAASAISISACSIRK
jgi:hypothetical protein